MSRTLRIEPERAMNEDVLPGGWRGAHSLFGIEKKGLGNETILEESPAEARRNQDGDW